MKVVLLKDVKNVGGDSRRAEGDSAQARGTGCP